MYMAKDPAMMDTSGGCPNAMRMEEVFHNIVELEMRKKNMTTRPVRE
jgi:hypothetical protein